MLLPFGGYKGSAIALMVELLAAGAIGERFSFEAAEADNKDGGPPRGGEFMLAISPELLAGPDWAEHCEAFFRRYDAIEGRACRDRAGTTIGVLRRARSTRNWSSAFARCAATHSQTRVTRRPEAR